MRELIYWGVGIFCIYWFLEAFTLIMTGVLLVGLIGGILQIAFYLVVGYLLLLVAGYAVAAVAGVVLTLIQNRREIGRFVIRKWITVSAVTIALYAAAWFLVSRPKPEPPPPVDLAYIQLKDDGFLSQAGIRARWLFQNKQQYKTKQGLFLRVGARRFVANHGKWVECD